MINREILRPIERATNRTDNGIGTPLPFQGVDIWNAWELGWLGPNRRPAIATASFVVSADSPNLVESKSLKLYLNSFAMTEFSNKAEVLAVIQSDLNACTGSRVDVEIEDLAASNDRLVSTLSGTCLDSLDVRCTSSRVDSDLLIADRSQIVEESFHTHLLRSLCPVTAQPDTGSLQIDYRGPRIEAGSFLRYVVSYREHNDFHEACIEKMFVDILEKCNPERLSLYARYQRRGGIDINPFRSTGAKTTENTRLWRQ